MSLRVSESHDKFSLAKYNLHDTLDTVGTLDIVPALAIPESVPTVSTVSR